MMNLGDKGGGDGGGALIGMMNLGDKEALSASLFLHFYFH